MEPNESDMAISGDIYCTLLSTDAYLPGAVVLAHSLRDSGTKKRLACLLVSDKVTTDTLNTIHAVFDIVLEAEPDSSLVKVFNRTNLRSSFEKVNLWRYTQFHKIVYIDSDAIALRCPDELFNIQEGFAAVPDAGWPDVFNTGVLVLTPNLGVFNTLKQQVNDGETFDGTDQGLINQCFEHKWKNLSFLYNCQLVQEKHYEPAYRRYKTKINIVHFIGNTKPWVDRSAMNGTDEMCTELWSKWWSIFDRHYGKSVSV